MWTAKEATGRSELAHELRRAIVPTGLILLAVLAAAGVAQGMKPQLARHEWGLDLIVLVRRVQWLLVGFSLISCMSLLTLVIGARRSPAWLVGLVPVVILLGVRFTGHDAGPGLVHDLPQFVDVDHPAAPGAYEWVVGLTFEGQTYAFSYRSLTLSPLVVVTDYSKRMLLIWSPHANRALAVPITRDLRPRALEVVSTPADGLLVYDRRYGQFISSITGLTLDGERPHGFGERIAVTKTTWSAWRALYPQTRVMLPRGDVAGISPEAQAPRSPLPDRVLATGPAEQRIAVIEARQPIAVDADLPLRDPLHLVSGDTRILLLRDPRTGSMRAFERRVSQDLFPTFTLRAHAGRGGPFVLIDSDTRTNWSLDGQAIDGPLRGERMREFLVEDGLWWGVMKFWYPSLRLVERAGHQ